MGKVLLKKAWAIGGEYYRPQDNPNEVPDRYLTPEYLPSTATVLDEDKAKEIEKSRKKEEPKALSQLKQEDILPPSKKG